MFIMICDHKWNSGAITKKATCEKSGVKTYTCSICKGTKTQTIKAVGHKYKITKTTKATTKKNGKLTKQCSICKKTASQTLYSAKKNAGTYKVTVTFKGQYSGKLTKSFEISKAKPKITASNFTKKKGDKAFYIKPKISPKGGKVTYKTSNKKIATVSSKGKVTIKKKGKVTITITSASNKNCSKVTKKITVTMK